MRQEFFDEDFDYAALILYVAKIFEIELNSSYIQELRWNYGVPMPAFYNEYDPEAGDLFISSGQQNVNINRCGSDRLMQIELGKFPFILRDVNEIQNNIDNDGLIELLQQLVRFRNPIIHAMVANRTDAESVYTCLHHFLGSYMDDIYNIKKRLKNNP